MILILIFDLDFDFSVFWYMKEKATGFGIVIESILSQIWLFIACASFWNKMCPAVTVSRSEWSVSTDFCPKI